MGDDVGVRMHRHVTPPIIPMVDAAKAKELKALFENIDKNGDGRVSSKEWGSAVGKNKAVMQKYFGGKDAKSIGKMFKKLDADGSGDLTWEEFVAGSKVLVSL